MTGWTNISVCLNKKFYMEQAVHEAGKSPFKGQKHGCVIVVGGRIIGRGYNSYKGINHSSNRSTHAEMAALKSVRDKDQLKGADLYVVRIRYDKEKKLVVRNSKPCDKCFPKLLKCMRNYGLRNVYYSIDY